MFFSNLAPSCIGGLHLRLEKVSATLDGSEILHQLRLVVYPTIYRVLYIPGGAGFQPSTVFSNFQAVPPVPPPVVPRPCLGRDVGHRNLVPLKQKRPFFG